MNSLSTKIMGQGVAVASRVHDYAQIEFKSGDLLNIFNSFTINGEGSADMQVVVGKTVTDVRENEASLRLEFEGIQLVVGLTDDAYSGPESLEFIPAGGGSRIVW